jgi:hypothetical protein
MPMLSQATTAQLLTTTLMLCLAGLTLLGTAGMVLLEHLHTASSYV